MGKQEFVDKLRMALNGRVAPEQVTENVRYYEDYINAQIRMGKSELAVLEELGDPRLIAKTIIDTRDMVDAGSAEYHDSEYRNSGYQNGGYQNNGYQNNGYRREKYQEERETHNKATIGGVQIPRWLWNVLMVIAAVLILSVVFSILSFLAPFIIVMLVVALLVKLFRDWLN